MPLKDQYKLDPEIETLFAIMQKQYFFQSDVDKTAKLRVLEANCRRQTVHINFDDQDAFNAKENQISLNKDLLKFNKLNEIRRGELVLAFHQVMTETLELTNNNRPIEPYWESSRVWHPEYKYE